MLTHNVTRHVQDTEPIIVDRVNAFQVVDLDYVYDSWIQIYSTFTYSDWLSWTQKPDSVMGYYDEASLPFTTIVLFH